MTCNKLVRIIFFLLITGITTALEGQNLVPNFSFEVISECPSNYGPIGPTLAPPWIAPTEGTPDLFNECAPNPDFGVPSNYTGYQYSFEGDGYFGVISYGFGNNFREYLTAPLIQPLEPDTWYQVSFYVNLANERCGIDKFGAYFSLFQPMQNNFLPLNFDPQVAANQGILDDTVNWELISGCFQANGGESYITLGNFYTDVETEVDPSCNFVLNYIYVDHVVVEETDEPVEIPLDLGGPETACYEYLIDPDLSGYMFLWEDGTTGPTLLVTESGVYSLTITDGCNVGIDSIDVTILSTIEDFDIGPPQFTLCDGESYTISLDPDLGSYEWEDGSSETEYVITTPGTYSVTVDDGCSTASDEMIVDLLFPPTPFDLGPDQNICAGPGNEVEFSFDPNLGDFEWQDGSSSSTYTITSGGLYSLTISNECGFVTDEILLSDLDIPEVNIGPATQQMCLGDEIEIEIDPALGSILWQDGSTDAEYIITTPGMYSVSVSNECGIGTDEMNVVLINPPVINLGMDTSLCEGDTLVLSAPGFAGDYMWQDNSNNDSLLVTSSGTYSLEIFNYCGSDFDQINVQITAAVAPLNFGPDLNICPGEQVILYASNPNANYLWQDSSTADSLLVTIPGTYTLIVYNICSMTSDTMVVMVNDDPPQVDLPSQLSLCDGQSVTLDAVVQNVSYLWNDNSQNQQLVTSTPGIYSVTVSNACGADIDTTIILDGGPAPSVALGNDLQICAGDTILLSPVFSNIDTWLWHDGSVMPQYNVTAAGQITVAVQNSCGTSYDTLQASLLPATPPLDLGADTSLCSGGSFVLSINTPGVTVLWPDGSTAPNYTVSAAGLVYAAISNSCGQSFDTVTVDALPDIPVLNLGPDQSLCPGEIIIFNPGIPNVQYLWQNGSTGNTFQTTQEGTIILSISNDCGVSTDTVEIIESTQGPVVDLGPDVQVCEGETVTILSGISGVNYLWQDGSTNPDYITTQSGAFILNVSNNCGSDSDTLVVDISGVPPTPALGPDTTLCEGVTLTLVSNADTETSIEWQNGSSSPTFTVSTPGIFTLVESNRCGDATDTVVVSYLDAPDPFSLGPDTILCPGESITLTAPATTFEIRWQDGSQQNSIVADQAQTYSLALSNICGQVYDELTLSFDTRIPTLHLDASIPWCEGDLIDLDATQPFLAEYSWSTGEIIPSIQISTPGIYSIDVNTLCQSVSQTVEVFEDADCIEVVIETNYEIYIPNVFSPNGDGINDVFTMSFGSDLIPTSIVGSIFDRWGNLVFHSDALTFAWDGYFADKTAMPGVYVYTIKVKYIELGVERVEEFVGDVTLIR